MNIIFFGPPGVGKGTQSVLLSRYLKIPRLVAGDLLREEKKSDSELGKKIAYLIDKGHFVSDELITSIIEKELQKPLYSNGVILDGFPRTVGQAQGLTRKIHCVISLTLSDKDCQARLLSRQDGRADDQPEIINERIKVYHQISKQTLEFYNGSGLVKIIDGSKTIEEVHSHIIKEVEDLKLG